MVMTRLCRRCDNTSISGGRNVRTHNRLGLVDVDWSESDNAKVSLNVRMRVAVAMLAVGAGAACATAPGGVAPRAFPGAPAPATPAPAPIPASPLPAAPGEAVTPVAPSPLPAPLGRDARANLAAEVLSTALGLRGIPYRLGGADLNGFDCSGFVQYVLARHEVQMPRTVAQQFRVGAPARAIEPGDLVFFQTIGSKVSHVGIAVDERSFVHAPNSRGVVRIDRLDAPYWAGRFLGARRVL